MKKISVIVPVYNSEAYLSECIESIINQSYKNLEIILVDDSSDDNSLEIIKQFAELDKRIKFKSFKENKGVSAARNYGIDIASGEYLYFLDSDDWIENDYLEVMLNTAEKTHSQVVMNRNMYSFIDNKCYPFNFQQKQLKIPDNTYVDIQKDTHNVFCGLCTKLYDSSFIKKHNLRFPEGYIYEDIFFHYVTFAYAEKVYFFNGSAYYYRNTQNSITSNMNQDGDKIINVLSLVYDFYKEFKLLNKGIKIYYTMPLFNIKDENTFMAFKNYFDKAGKYILNNDIYNEMDKYVCKNIMITYNYNDYITKYPANLVISYIRRKNA